MALKLDRAPGSVRLPPPAIGEHSREVLARFGISDDRIATLEAGETIR